MHSGFWLIQIGRNRLRWGDNIKWGLKKLLWERLDWIRLVRDGDKWSAVGNAVMNLRIP